MWAHLLCSLEKSLICCWRTSTCCISDLSPIIVCFQVETLLHRMYLSHKDLPTHWVLADECKARTPFFQTRSPILSLLLHPLQSTTLPSAAPAEQLDVFTDQHLLFTTPQVVAPASSLLHISQTRICQSWVFNNSWRSRSCTGFAALSISQWDSSYIDQVSTHTGNGIK